MTCPTVCGRDRGCKELCDFAENFAEGLKHGDHASDPYSWQADRAADAYERAMDGRWSA